MSAKRPRFASTAEPLLHAVDVLRSDGTARPTGFLRPNSKWSRLLRTQSDHRLWKTAVLFHLRDAFRAGDVWLARSRRYGDIRKALLSAPVVADADRSLPAPASPHDWLAERRFALDEGLRRLAAAARAGAIAGGSIEDSVLRVERTPCRTGPLTWSPTSTGGCPRRASRTSSSRCTTPPCRDRVGLLNVLLAEATTTNGCGRSSDGQFFPAGGRGEALNLVNARYGAEPGVKAYSHVSDRFSPFATQTIRATVHEAPYILDGLLMNETGRRVREQYVDHGRLHRPRLRRVLDPRLRVRPAHPGTCAVVACGSCPSARPGSCPTATPSG